MRSVSAVAFALVAACLSLAVAARDLRLFQGQLPHSLAVDSSKPWFCHGLECPSYKVLNKTDIYELRQYEPAIFAFTKVQGYTYTLSLTEGFMRLFKYIGGANADGQKIEMTAPVATLVEPGPGVFCKSNFTVAFYLPEKVQKSPPKPNEDLDISFVDSPAKEVYVMSFGGYLTDITLTAKVQQLKASLAADNLEFDDSDYMTFGYDPPTRVTGRHNEVGVLATHQHAASAA